MNSFELDCALFDQLAFVYSTLDSLSACDRWLLKCLSSAQFAYDTCFLEFLFELLECAVDCLVFFDWDDDHSCDFFVFKVCKGNKNIIQSKLLYDFSLKRNSNFVSI